MKKHFAFLIFFGCTATSPDLPQLALGDSLEIDFQDTPMFNGSYSWGYFEDSFYYTSDHLDSLGLHVFSFAESDWESTYLPYEGPNGLKRHDSFVILNDTLAFHGLSGNFGFQIVNLKTKQVKDYYFIDKMINPGKVIFHSVYFDGEVIGFPITEYKGTDNPDYTKESMIYGLYSLVDKEFRHFIPFPEEFHGDTFSTNFLNHTFYVKADSILVNFAKSDYLYGYDLEGDLILQKLAKTKGVKTQNPGRKSDPMENMVLSELGGKYSGLLYDGRDFYRIALTFPDGLKKNNSDFLSIQEAFASSIFQILKLDSDFKIVAEGSFSGAPGHGGIGDGLYFVKKGMVYFWDLNKGGVENIERFKPVELEKE
ncbi:DUF4221 domain-containing protein [Aquiflexum sp. LQ15W]|uniref:DUF4221 domain-containing protein n=1 Tax=Cognataquiflexum nitidum TaxID=2922272 RepID=UPI001F13BA19|nr:DUF4221 domain-containing protein [Cognataquiflexum nitidum]MCH6200310.1 DUF4221 domain-containing protein [Cognataquiflexum nitidum]